MRRHLLSLALSVGLITGIAWSQEATPEKNALDAAAEAENRLTKEPESVVVPVFILGDVGVKGQNVFIRVRSARGSDGVGLKDLTGVSLKVTGKKIQRLEQMDGKEVELRGNVKDSSEFEVLSYTERRTPTAAESESAQGARGPVGAPRGALNAKGTGAKPAASGVRTPIGALNDPQGAGPNKPNTGTIGTLRGRKKPTEPDLTPDLGAPAAAAAAAVR